MNAIRNIAPLGFPWKTQDPFLFCVYHRDLYPKGNDQAGPAASLKGRRMGQDFELNEEGWRMYHGRKVPGFPAHPHVGFETITIVTEGIVDHADSLGAAGRFGHGDVQWMTAGNGVQHSEMFPLLNKEKDNPLELFQIWLNLSREGKKAAPYFSMLWADTIPDLQFRDEQAKVTRVRIITGAIGGSETPPPPPDSWAADPKNEVAIWLIEMEPGAAWILPAASRGVNRSLFFFSGTSTDFDGSNVDSGKVLELDATTDLPMINNDSTARFLVLQGKPIGEPVVQHGPFVVNRSEEIGKIIAEYQKTQFGGWPWPDFEHVHPADRGRFAKYPDGKEESRPL